MRTTCATRALVRFRSEGGALRRYARRLPKVLHIIEPGLSHESGHFPSLLRAVVHAAAPHFDRIRVYGHRSVDVKIEGAEVVPHFVRRMRRFMVMLLARKLLREDGVILFNTAANSDFIAVKRALAFTPRPRARVVFFRHMHYPHERCERWMRELNAKMPSVILACPTKGCCDDMRRVGFANVHEIPYPHVELPGDAEAPRAASEAPVRVVLPGVPRVDKGLPQVLALAEHLHAKGSAIPLVVQTSTDHWDDYQAGVEPYRERLRRCPYKHLTLIEERPDAAAFARMFHGNVILVPYDPELFRERISGITLDALRFGCPVITTADTWMARQVEPFGAGELLRTREPEEFEAAIKKVLADLPRYRENARRAGASVVQQQAASPLAEVLAG